MRAAVFCLSVLALAACGGVNEANKSQLARSVTLKHSDGQDENSVRQLVGQICGSSADITLLRAPVPTAVPGEVESIYRCTY